MPRTRTALVAALLAVPLVLTGTARAADRAPGDVVSAGSTTASSVPSKAWHITYASTSAKGAPTVVSGTVIVPAAAYDGTRPIAAYAPGTQGWGDQCAPSAEMKAGSFDEQFAVDNLLKRGWAVVVTDYPGLGTPGEESYNVGIPEGHAVLDAVRAAQRLPDAGLSASAKVGVEGYSQGGGAAGWAAQEHRDYAPGVNLVGVAGGGTPANLQAVAKNINGTAFFAFLAGTAIGFNAEYPEVDLQSSLTDAGKKAMKDLSGMCQVQGLATYAGKRIEDYTVGGVNPIDDPKWTKALDANNLGGTAPDVPVLQYHGLADGIIPWRVESDLHRQWCAAGVTSKLAGYPGEHVITHVEAQNDVVNWLADRFAGKDAPENC